MTWIISFWVVLVVAMGLAIGCAVLWSRWQALGVERDRLREDLTQAQTQCDALGNAFHDKQNENAALTAKLAAQEQLRLQDAEAKHMLLQQFEALAGKVFQQSSEQFLKLAAEKFKGEQTKATGELEKQKLGVKSLVDPINETLKGYQKSLQEVEKARQESYGKLGEQVKRMIEDHGKLRQSTDNLVKALRRPEVRGRWGEMQLRRVVELAGMIEHCDFDEQVSVRTSDGTLRPDMVVRLPNQRNIVVDAKTSLDAFLNAIEADNEADRDSYLQQHVGWINDHVRNLAGKQYASQFDHSPDFVVMFIPGESFLYPAVQRQPDLIEKALEKGVVIAAPTTLISLLKAVALGWREEQLAENAQRISEVGKELHDRLCTASKYVTQLGKAIESAMKSYNSFVGSYESRLLTQARKFEDLGAQSAKQLPASGEVSPLEGTIRELKHEDMDGGE